jgi:hypothetical protein
VCPILKSEGAIAESAHSTFAKLEFALTRRRGDGLAARGRHERTDEQGELRETQPRGSAQSAGMSNASVESMDAGSTW